MRLRKSTEIIFYVTLGLFLLDILTTHIGVMRLGLSEAGKLTPMLWNLYGYLGGTVWWFFTVMGIQSNFLVIALTENKVLNKIGDGLMFGVACVWVYAIINNTILIILQSIETLL